MDLGWQTGLARFVAVVVGFFKIYIPRTGYLAWFGTGNTELQQLRFANV